MIETEAVHIQGLDDEALLQFYAGSSLRTDFGNWYVPTIEALRNLCRAAGFSSVRTVAGPPDPPAAASSPAQLQRAPLARAIDGSPPPRHSAPSANSSRVVHSVTPERSRRVMNEIRSARSCGRAPSPSRAGWPTPIPARRC